MRLLTAFAILLMYSITSIQAQSCYVQESSFLGLDLSDKLLTLENKSCEVKDSLPAEFQNSFKVYSFGFYSFNKDMESGSDRIWEDYLNQISSPYFVAFGTELNDSNNESQMYVKVQFPTTGIFECYTAVDKALIENRFEQILSETYSMLGKSASASQTVEIEVLDAVISEITKAKGCCIPGNKGSLRSEFCTACPDNYNEVSYLFTSNGYVEITIQDPVISSFIDTSGSIKHFSKINGLLNGNPIDVNDDVGGYLSKMDLKMEGISGNILHFDPYDLECQSILEYLGIGSDENSALKGKSGSVRNGAEIVYSLNIVSYLKSETEASIFILVESPKTTNEGKTIYLQNLDGCCIDLELVKNKVINYYSLLGVYRVPKDNWQNVYPKTDCLKEKDFFKCDAFDLIPNVEIVEYLYAYQIKENTIVLFGNPSQIVDAAQEQYKDISGSWAYDSENGVGSVCRFTYESPYGAEPPLEMGLNPGSLSLVRSDISDDVDDFKAGNVDNLAAFLTFHATGHNAGCGHFRDSAGTSPFNSYMSAGCYVSRYYLGVDNDCTVSKGDTNYESIEELITETISTGEYELIIKKKIYERYIK